jgi:hypothetical protein
MSGYGKPNPTYLDLVFIIAEEVGISPHKRSAGWAFPTKPGDVQDVLSETPVLAYAQTGLFRPT